MAASPADFACWLVERDTGGRVRGAPTRLRLGDLPPGDLLVRVGFSSLNYKDGLAATGHPGVAKRLPQIPGIDAAGRVVESADGRFKVGDRVLVSGREFGAGAWGGWSEYARVPADWALALPPSLSEEEAATLGVAGLTAALSVKRLLAQALKPGDGEILVTGSTGGVGSLALMILAGLGFKVVASTGKPERAAWLAELGASRVIDRHSLEDDSTTPLLKSAWAGVVDSVGGLTLATALRSTRTGGCVTACGLVGGTELALTVHPFILRGITLCGIDSAWTPAPEREELLALLAGPWRPAGLAKITRRVALADLAPEIEAILAGRIAGRTLVGIGG